MFNLFFQLLRRITVREDYGNLSQPQRVSKMWKSIKKRFGACLSMPGRTSCVASNYSDFELPDNDVLVEVTQVMQPVCSTLTTLDITGKQFSNGFKIFQNSYADCMTF